MRLCFRSIGLGWHSSNIHLTSVAQCRGNVLGAHGSTVQGNGFGLRSVSIRGPKYSYGGRLLEQCHFTLIPDGSANCIGKDVEHKDGKNLDTSLVPLEDITASPRDVVSWA